MDLMAFYMRNIGSQHAILTTYREICCLSGVLPSVAI